jgi:hypothetical protein
LGIQTGSQIKMEDKNKYKNITEVSFMIFRTGSLLIVGMCDELVLNKIYEFLKNLLKTEFNYICQKIILPNDDNNKNKKKKIRKKIIHIFPDIDCGEVNSKEINDITMNKTKKINVKVKKNIEFIEE